MFEIKMILDALLAKIKMVLKSRTMLFSMLIMAFGVIQTNLPMIQKMFSPSTYGMITMGIGIVVGLLRILTTTSLKDK